MEEFIQQFRVSDKVALRPDWQDHFATVPRLVPGRVYCVVSVQPAGRTQWVRLLGVRNNRRKCIDNRGVAGLALALVSRAAQADTTEEKEAA